VLGQSVADLEILKGRGRRQFITLVLLYRKWT